MPAGAAARARPARRREQVADAVACAVVEAPAAAVLPDLPDRAAPPSPLGGAVLRGALNKITLGFCANVQERCVLHAALAAPTGLPAETLVDRYVTVGTYSLLRSCTTEPECIGQHSILMEGSLVETNSILGARRIATGELWAGSPARFVQKLTNEEIVEIPKLATAINDLMQSHFSEFLPYSNAYLEVEKLKKSFFIPL